MKLGGWVVMLLVFCIVLNIVGISSIGSTILSKFNIGIDDEGTVTNANLSGSTLWIAIIAALTVLGAAGLIIGTFGKGYDPSLLLAPLIVTIGGIFIGTFFSTILFVRGLDQLWLTYITLIIFVGMAAGFIMACLNYFGGR